MLLSDADIFIFSNKLSFKRDTIMCVCFGLDSTASRFINQSLRRECGLCLLCILKTTQIMYIEMFFVELLTNKTYVCSIRCFRDS